MAEDKDKLKPLVWIASAHKDFLAFPASVHDEAGYALYLAQIGKRHEHAKVFKGFGDAGVVEIVTSFDDCAFRTVYTVRFATAIYVLHAFQKKSKSGVKTPPHDIELIRKRLKDAKKDHDASARKTI